MFGFFLFVMLTQLIKWWWTVQMNRGRSTATAFLILVGVVVVLVAAWIGFQELPEPGAEFSVLAINVFMLFLIVSILIQGYPTLNEAFPLLLALVGCGIVAGCELIFVRDFYQGGDMRRFNTIFKFYLQAWFMFAIASAYLISRRTRIRPATGRRGMERFFIRTASALWNLVFAFLLAGSLIFTFWGVHARHHHDEYRRVDLPLTLDGWAYMKQGFRADIVDEYRAIQWLQKNVRGTPVILEASGADYLYRYGDVSGNTGLPTVLGWWSHVDQREYVLRKSRRKGRRDRPVDYTRIKRDIVSMYESGDIEEVLKLLGTYHVEYIFVGPTERQEYPAFGLEKFKEMSAFMTPVYSNPNVVIYRVNDYGHGVDLSDAVANNSNLAELRERMKKKEEEERLAREVEEREREERMMNQAPRNLFRGIQGKARGMFQEPRSLAIAPDGSIYVADFRNHRVQKFDASGKWETMWGTTGNEPGEFNDICDVAADNTQVYVLDTFNNRVQVFAPDGRYLRNLIPDTGSFSHPRGIETAGGFVYVCDTGNSRIVKMTPQGKTEGVFGRPGKAPMQFDNPIGICAHDGALYIADVGNRRIQVISTEGGFIRSYPLNGWDAEVFNEPYVAVTADNHIWYTDPTKHVVIRKALDGSVVREYSGDSDGRQFNLPMGLAVDADGDVLVSDAGTHNVHRIRVEDVPDMKKPERPVDSDALRRRDLTR